MNTLSNTALAVAALVCAGPAAAAITFYEHDDFQGRSFTTEQPVNNFARAGFNGRASSVVVRGDRLERWEVCDSRRFRGQCVVLRPGEYPSPEAMGLSGRVSSVRSVGRGARDDGNRDGPAGPPVQAGQVVFYENEGFQGRSMTAGGSLSSFSRSGFNDRASSAVVRGGRAEVCEDAGYRGRCAVLQPGQYASLGAMGLNDRVSSVRMLASTARVDDARYGPPPVVVGDYGRRDNERLYQADITSVRAVVDSAGQRCWAEREEVVQDRGNANVPGALLGAVIGGVLGHQVGGGSGKDVATGIGVLAGAAIGARQGRGSNGPAPAQNVQRCSNAPGVARPAYWDVTYRFRGTEHRMQMTTPPGATVQVNDRGEPRA